MDHASAVLRKGSLRKVAAAALAVAWLALPLEAAADRIKDIQVLETWMGGVQTYGPDTYTTEPAQVP